MLLRLWREAARDPLLGPRLWEQGLLPLLGPQLRPIGEVEHGELHLVAERPLPPLPRTDDSPPLLYLLTGEDRRREPRLPQLIRLPLDEPSFT